MSLAATNTFRRHWVVDIMDMPQDPILAYTCPWNIFPSSEPHFIFIGSSDNDDTSSPWLWPEFAARCCLCHHCGCLPGTCKCFTSWLARDRLEVQSSSSYVVDLIRWLMHPASSAREPPEEDPVGSIYTRLGRHFSNPKIFPAAESKGRLGSSLLLMDEVHQGLSRPHFDSDSALDMEDLGNALVLQKLRKESKQCSCSKCAALCHGNPGIYSPDQFLDLADDQKATLFSNLIQDYYLPEDRTSPIFFLRPAAVGELPGSLADLVPSYGVCGNLTCNGCRLPRNEMPTGCLVALPCRTDSLRPSVDRAEVPRVWGIDRGRAVIQEFERVIQARFPGRPVGLLSLQPHLDAYDAKTDAQIQAFVDRKAAHVCAVERSLRQGQVGPTLDLDAWWTRTTTRQAEARAFRHQSH